MHGLNITFNGLVWHQGKYWPHEWRLKDLSLAFIHMSNKNVSKLPKKGRIRPKFWSRTILAQMNTLYNSRFYWYVNQKIISNITHITLGLNSMNECRQLKCSYNIGWNDCFKMIFYHMVTEKERGSLVMIFPRHLF